MNELWELLGNNNAKNYYFRPLNVKENSGDIVIYFSF